MARKQAANVKITLEVPQGIVRWLKDNERALGAHSGMGVRTAKEYFEDAILSDFEATLDSMRFDKKQVCSEYGITSFEEKTVRLLVDTETVSALEKAAKEQNLSVDEYVQRRLLETPVVI